MSNIQITENESGKYSPEWFYTESQTPEWIAFAHKADELRENFINLFGIERLKSLSGRNLLTSLFYNDEGNKTNLCYMLEMDKDIREVFGGISGGSAYKFGLFYHKKNQSWTCGSPLRPIHLTEEEAIQKAEEIRNDLIEGAEIISSFGPLNSEEDYEQLYKQLGHISGINMVWRMKYYQILFPTLFAPFYGQDIHFFENTVAELIALTEGESELKVRRALARSRMLSSDVSAAYDPLYAEHYEKRNSGFFGRGISMNKFTGVRGKSGSNDANAEYIAVLRKIFDDANVAYQFDELGKVDAGGGGTIAYIMANYGMEVIDSGIALLCMHAPYEVSSKADIYEAVKGYRAFLANA